MEPPYFARDTIAELVKSAESANLLTRRDILMEGLLSLYVGNLKVSPRPLEQVQIDLGQMNRDGPRIDGSIPLVTWLKNAVDNTDADAPRKVFQRCLDELLARTTGLPARPEPSALPEYKEVIIHQDDMVDFGFLQAGVRAGASVAKLVVPRFLDGKPELRGGQPLQFSGTGWLISKDLLITNHHVIVARDRGERLPDSASLQLQARACEALFGYDSPDAQGSLVKVIALEASDPVLDYALLRLERPPGAAPLRLRSAKLEVDANSRVAVNIIQHPRGNPKRIAIRNNLVTRSEGHDLRYFTDTDGGSSGSPVFDDSWQVVALHRGAIQLATGVSFQGKPSAWINVGTRLEPVLRHLESLPHLRAEIG